MLQTMFRFGLMVGIALTTAGRLAAQAVPFRGAVGRDDSVQLPTFNFFTISTSVEVPDSGEAFLGGNSSSSDRQFAAWHSRPRLPPVHQ